jgi:hypothetical protein
LEVDLTGNRNRISNIQFRVRALNEEKSKVESIYLTTRYLKLDGEVAPALVRVVFRVFEKYNLIRVLGGTTDSWRVGCESGEKTEKSSEKEAE